MVGRLTDIEEVIDHAAHHVTRVHAIEVAEAKPLILVEKVLAHLRFHAGAHDMALGRHEIAACATNEVHDYEPNGNHADRCHNRMLPLGEKTVGERAQNHRKRKVNTCDNKRANGIGNEKMLLRAIVGKKTAEHG